MSEAHSISLFESVILGFVQGATEFLPISSSGHLVIIQNLFGMQGSLVLFDVMMHVGTLLAILLVFRKDIINLAQAAIAALSGGQSNNEANSSVLMGIVVGSVPTALIGATFSEQFKQMFASMTAAGIGLIMTGLILMSTVVKGGGRNDTDGPGYDRIRFSHALLIGAAQGLAITPGISRSGATIALALLLGVERGLAARFSFLLAIPAIVGALALEMKSHLHGMQGISGGVDVAVMFCGMIVAAITGTCALKFLLRVVRQGRISLFAYYCWALGLVAIGLGIVRR